MQTFPCFLQYQSYAGAFFYVIIKSKGFRPDVALFLDDARTMVEKFIDHYNESGGTVPLGYVASVNKLSGWEPEILKEHGN